MSDVIDSHFILQTLLANNSDPVVVKDSDLNVILANEAFLQFFPVKHHEKVIVSNLKDILTATETALMVERDRIALETGSSRVVEKLAMPDGNMQIFDIHRVRFEDENGAVFLISTSRCVTEREQLIDKLTRSNEELERFAFIASHDLQEPLRMVRNFTELLQMEYGELLGEEARKYMKITTESAEHMQNLVDDLLTYSRLDEDGAPSEVINVEDILDYVKTNLDETIKIDHAQITHGKLPNLIGSPVRFSRVLQNLISNALKYQVEGAVPQIHIAADDLEDAWLFSVKDNGIGMHDEYREQIFLPFKRLHGKANYRGTGLGLAICRRIVESMGGLIWVESKIDAGSTFSFTIPKD